MIQASALQKRFTGFAKWTSHAMGQPAAFVIAAGIIVFWGVTGPVFHFGDSWQLVINTGTTIITFLMVFLIQNTQNRDGAAVQIKLDELIRAVEGAHNALLDLEELSDEQLVRIRARYEQAARQARLEMREHGILTEEPEQGGGQIIRPDSARE